MIVEVISPATGKRYRVRIDGLTEEVLVDLEREYASEEQLQSHLEALPLPAEVKCLLARLARVTLRVGRRLLRIGRRLLEIVLMLCARFPGAGLGLLTGALLTYVVACLPFLGAILADFLGPLLMLFGLGRGLWQDLTNRAPEAAATIVSAVRPFTTMQQGGAASGA
ncbi:hypothetical protein AWR36_006100 [Microbulbifer flavimaris]|uniref:Phage holin family protein n=1 Tax=Microbulbifer flavimaris TaxID=1781068 RepID=A0ABX4I0E8_9GAMM|nr:MULTISPECIES: hypothetical protein [Microbulbifer]KUJ83430.1 hypothetical protein AVO43_06085 [Microbulbifer sp. ZGT114]PCO05586.1 hypothetical protein AWR36_006100 [Microbulbifer flavimaris]